MIGRFTDAAMTLYDKLTDLVEAQKEFSEKNFGPARERDARGPLDHLRKECTELYDLIELWNAGKLPATENVDSEIADLLILFLDVLWRTGRKFGAAVDAALAKMEENVKRGWPPHVEWVELFDRQSVKLGKDGTPEYEVGLIRGGGLAPQLDTVTGRGPTPEAAREDAYQQIRDLNAQAVEHVREPVKEQGTEYRCGRCGTSVFVHPLSSANTVPLCSCGALMNRI
jgi:hypothetical protein